MTGPEVMRAFREWWPETRWERVYPLYIGRPHAGQWYVRERMPGTRVWRAGEDGSFKLLEVVPWRLTHAEVERD